MWHTAYQLCTSFTLFNQLSTLVHNSQIVDICFTHFVHTSHTFHTYFVHKARARALIPGPLATPTGSGPGPGPNVEVCMKLIRSLCAIC